MPARSRRAPLIGSQARRGAHPTQNAGEGGRGAAQGIGVGVHGLPPIPKHAQQGSSMPANRATRREGEAVDAAEAAHAVEAAKTAPRWIGFASGVVAGATGVLVGHAFDTLKVQAQVGAGPSQPSGATAEPALHRILALYRGIVPPLLTTGAIRSLYFGVFENLRASLADSSLQATVALSPTVSRYLPPSPTTSHYLPPSPTI